MINLPGRPSINPLRINANKCIFSEQALNAFLFDFSENGANNSKRDIYIAKNLLEYLEKRLKFHNRIRLSERGLTPTSEKNLEGEVARVSLEIRDDVEYLHYMRRREAVQKFVREMEEAEEARFTDQQRYAIVSEIMAAIEKGLKVGNHLVLPTQEELEEKKALYADRPVDPETNRPQSIIKFLETGWPAPFIAAGLLTRPDFRRIDPKAEQALKNWVRETKTSPPPHVHIPTKSEVIDRELDEYPDKIKTAWRLARAHDRRRSGGPQR